MENITVSKWDAADYIETKEDVISYLAAAVEENDPKFILSAIGDIARSKGMTQLARELNLDRAGLYRALSENGNPSFIMIYSLLDTLGFRLKIERKSA
ncbi:MAG: putative addiction module antidote protein [Spirochaetaceae bacterium]|jgi:probable addiction module antidote protein|nr:putative addiction module antidote protein [Spirochaetaceae bacterium]